MTPTALGVFVNTSTQGNTMALTACLTAPTLVCGEMELNPQGGQDVPSLKARDIISVGTVANSSDLADALH